MSRPERLRTVEECFAAGQELGATFPPLTDDQRRHLAVLLAPIAEERRREARGDGA